jgi:hypothetical protein
MVHPAAHGRGDSGLPRNPWSSQPVAYNSLSFHTNNALAALRGGQCRLTGAIRAGSISSTWRCIVPQAYAQIGAQGKTTVFH